MVRDYMNHRLFYRVIYKRKRILSRSRLMGGLTLSNFKSNGQFPCPSAKEKKIEKKENTAKHVYSIKVLYVSLKNVHKLTRKNKDVYECRRDIYWSSQAN